MAVIEEPRKVSVGLELNTGTHAGVMTTKTIKLGTLNTTTWNAQKVINIVDLAEPCLQYPINAVRKTLVSDLVEDD